ncbi:Pkinase-domain-containing protein [Trametes meyenii]|nr:Pkinase-domain-containing protein [Trametes meyenii]
MPVSPSASDWIPDFLGKTIDNDHYLLTEVLGQGAYGVVFRGVDQSPGAGSSRSQPKDVAVKIMEKADPESRRWKYQQREVANHLEVADHPGVVSVLGAYECDYFIYIILEYCEGGDLFNPMIDRLEYCRDDDAIKAVFLQIVEAVEYCHEHGIYHRDLKPDNILTIDDGDSIRIGDFGLSTTAKVSDTFCCGSTNYMSPECFGEDYDYHPYSTEAADVWSLGVILTNLIVGRNPWEQATLSDNGYFNYLTRPGYLREILPISEGTAWILEGIFTTDPGVRITLPQLRHRVLSVREFFMSDEDLARASKHVQAVATAYTRPEEQEFCTADVINQLPADDMRSRPSVQSSLCAPKFVICASSGISNDGSVSSLEESEGPITPPTHAQDPTKLADVPEMDDGDRIGAAETSDMQKDRFLPVSPNNASTTIVL